MFSIVISLIVIASLGFLYRAHGGGFVNFPWKIAEVLIGIVLASVAYLLTQNPADAGIAFALAVVLKVLGHGQYMTLDFSKTQKYIEPEKIDTPLGWFFGEDPRTATNLVGLTKTAVKAKVAKAINTYGINKLYNRCLVGLALSGSLVGLGLAIGLASAGMLLEASVVIVGFGIAKASAYALGWKFYPAKATETGEIVAGLLTGTVLALLILTH